MWRIIVIILDNDFFFYRLWSFVVQQDLVIFGRSQFYIALKLVAVAQSGFPLRVESINTGNYGIY